MGTAGTSKFLGRAFGKVLTQPEALYGIDYAKSWCTKTTQCSIKRSAIGRKL